MILLQHVNRKLLFCLLINLSLFADDQAKAGQVIAVKGKVKAVGLDKAERDLKRTDPFYVSDTIIVAEDSNTQLKFTDSGVINLIALTEYKIDSYIYNDPKKKSESVSTLTKGGFKALSGGVAKENPEGSLLRTPVATIGLRGTTYEGVLKNKRFSVGCERGLIAVKNDLGEVDIGPTSRVKYATVEEGQSPKESAELPIDLTGISFTVEGGETFEQAEAEQMHEEATEETGGEEAEGGGEEEVTEESEEQPSEEESASEEEGQEEGTLEEGVEEGGDLEEGASIEGAEEGGLEGTPEEGGLDEGAGEGSLEEGSGVDEGTGNGGGGEG